MDAEQIRCQLRVKHSLTVRTPDVVAQLLCNNFYIEHFYRQKQLEFQEQLNHYKHQ